ncbi:hypothetical protein ZIOFF_013180 [Zingiber officinale]|uniref:MADS-box domain-containing protein n=1 Tax=Zingiber officinale TaxID=94328 RepID=A0A8J5HR57_ZINOF|nr:hypothetical protein ZIOFF_013180 [Zingiber officinale]
MARTRPPSKGRRKIEMKKIQSEDARHVCFSKRKAGIFAKASDISTLCGVDVVVMMYSPAGNPYSFGSPSVDQVVDRFLLGNLLQFDANASLNLNHVHQQLSQEYMDLSNQLEAAKDRSVNLKDRIANAQTQEFDVARDINRSSLEQVDRLMNGYERLKVKTVTRITEILRGDANLPMVGGSGHLARNMGTSMAPWRTLLCCGDSILQFVMYCLFSFMIWIRFKKREEATVWDDRQNRALGATPLTQLFLLLDPHHQGPATISSSPSPARPLLSFTGCISANPHTPDQEEELSVDAIHLQTPTDSPPKKLSSGLPPDVQKPRDSRTLPQQVRRGVLPPLLASARLLLPPNATHPQAMASVVLLWPKHKRPPCKHHELGRVAVTDWARNATVRPNAKTKTHIWRKSPSCGCSFDSITCKKPCASSCPFSYATLARTPSYLLTCPSMHSIPGWPNPPPPLLHIGVINPREKAAEHTHQSVPLLLFLSSAARNGPSPLDQLPSLIHSSFHCLQQFSRREIIIQERGEQTKVRTLIGSRPPMCERSCRACGHCEAVQVPVIPQALNKDRSKKLQASASDSRGDMSSNYKPLSWKCKCGNLIFNP